MVFDAEPHLRELERDDLVKLVEHGWANCVVADRVAASARTSDPLVAEFFERFLNEPRGPRGFSCAIDLDDAAEWLARRSLPGDEPTWISALAAAAIDCPKPFTPAVRRTPKGTSYLKEAGVALLASTALRDGEGFSRFLAGLGGFADYLADPVRLEDADQVVKYGGQTCFSDDTEILTRRGWRLFADVVDGDEVLTLSPNDGAAEWQAVESRQSYDYTGELFEADGRDVSFCVTPDHRQWALLGHRNEEREDYAFFTTEDLEHKLFAVRTAASRWVGRFPEFVETRAVRVEQVQANQHGKHGTRTAVLPAIRFEGESQLTALALLCVYYATEGSPNRGQGEGLTIYGHHVAAVQAICETLNLRCNVWVDKRNNVPRVVVGGGRRIRLYFEEHCGSGSFNKKLPDWVLDLPSQALEAVWRSLVVTDGHEYKNGRQILVTTSPTLAGQAQEILCKLGHSSSVSSRAGVNHPVLSVSRKAGRDALVNRHATIKRVPYSGVVRCVSTRNGVVYVRRNGVAHFSGNCYASFGEKRTKNADADRYFANLKRSGHWSVLEHASFTFLLWGIDRTCTHELVRHRHGSFSQVSQRYVGPEALRFVLRPEKWVDDAAWADDEARRLLVAMRRAFERGIDRAASNYARAIATLDALAARGHPDLAADDATARRKRVRQVARDMLPNCVEAPIDVTGNARMWRGFIDKRATVHADLPIRDVAVKVLRILRRVAPLCFNDYEVYTADDGREAARTEFAGC